MPEPVRKIKEEQAEDEERGADVFGKNSGEPEDADDQKQKLEDMNHKNRKREMTQRKKRRHETAEERIWILGLRDEPVAAQKVGVRLVKRVEKINQLSGMVEKIRSEREEEEQDDANGHGHDGKFIPIPLGKPMESFVFCHYNEAAMEKDPVEKIRLSDRIEVSVVIPHFSKSRDENLQGLLEELRRQSIQEMEIIIVSGVSPQGRAINQGVRSAQGEILVIIDDDSRLGHPRVVENLVRVIRGDPSIGMAGASVVNSEKGTRFQKAAGRQFPRYHMPVVEKVTDSDLPGHPCVAFPKKVFVQTGMEREDILRGLDPDLRVRIRKAGYRVVLAPETWIHHPLPENLLKFIRVFLRNGYGSAYLQRFYPEINYDTDEALNSQNFAPKHSFLYRALRYPARLGKALVAFQWIRLIGYTVYMAGYLAGWIRFTFSKSSSAKIQSGIPVQNR